MISVQHVFLNPRLLPRLPTACFDLIHVMIQNDLLMLHLIGCGCSRSGTPRTAAHWVQWSWQSRSHRFRCCCCCCCGKSSLCRPATTTLPSAPAGWCGERPASLAAGRTEALYSCTSCCKDAPCLCCCSQRKTEGTVWGQPGECFNASIHWNLCYSELFTFLKLSHYWIF